MAKWLVFVVDLLGRLWLAERRAHYFVRHVPDLLVLVLGPLRLLVLAKVLNRQAGNALRGRVAIYVGTAAVTLIFSAGFPSPSRAVWWRSD